jgi:MFS family permease
LVDGGQQIPIAKKKCAGVGGGLQIVTPAAAHQSMPVLIATRVIMGLGEGLSQPVIHQLLSAWAPPTERSRLVAIASAGQPLGTVAAMMSSPIAARHWPSVFHYFGMAGVVWCVVAAQRLRDKPRVTDGVSEAEVEYIEQSLAAQQSAMTSRKAELSLPPLPTAIGPLLMTKHFAAIYIAHFCANWSIYIVISWVPTYLSSLGASLDSVGGFAVVPYICYWVVDVGWAHYLDRLIMKGTSIRRARILSQAVCTIGPSFALAWMIVYPPRTPHVS